MLVLYLCVPTYITLPSLTLFIEIFLEGTWTCYASIHVSVLPLYIADDWRTSGGNYYFVCVSVSPLSISADWLIYGRKYYFFCVTVLYLSIASDLFLNVGTMLPRHINLCPSLDSICDTSSRTNYCLSGGFTTLLRSTCLQSLHLFIMNLYIPISTFMDCTCPCYSYINF